MELATCFFSFYRVGNLFRACLNCSASYFSFISTNFALRKNGGIIRATRRVPDTAVFVVLLYVFFGAALQFMEQSFVAVPNRP